MYRRFLAGFTAALLLALPLACSSDAPSPTSPSSSLTSGSAGAGSGGSTLKVSAPTTISPIGNEEIESLTPTLVVGNVSGSFGSGSFTYRFELSDKDGRVIREGTVTADSDRTEFPITEALGDGTSFSWRSRAELEGFFGPWSDTATFRTVETVVIGAPTPLTPVGGVAVTESSPLFTVTNGAVKGKAGQVDYYFQVAEDEAFASSAATGNTPRSADSTTSITLGPFSPGRTFYWRVWGTNGKVNSGFSAVQTFLTPEPIVVEAPIPVAPVGGTTVISPSPDFVVTNGRVSGPVTLVIYWFQVATDQTFGSITVSGSKTRSTSQTTTINLGALAADTLFFWRAWGMSGNVTSPFSAIQSFRTPRAVKRTPDPPTGQKLPLPNMSHIPRIVAAEHPSWLRNSCQDAGGTWQFMDAVVDRLRENDTRWGYNWKRGVIGDASRDIVDYHWGPGSDENSTQVYIIDIIGSHCGSNPGPAWDDKTQITLDSGTVGRWTGRGRF